LGGVPVIPVPQLAPAILRQCGQTPRVPEGHIRFLSPNLGKGQPGAPNRAGAHSLPWPCDMLRNSSQHKTLDPVRHPESLKRVATNPPVHRPSQIGAVPSQWQLPKSLWAWASPMDKTAIARSPTARSVDRVLMTQAPCQTRVWMALFYIDTLWWMRLYDPAGTQAFRTANSAVRRQVL
jgi:hypothetical protein